LLRARGTRPDSESAFPLSAWQGVHPETSLSIAELTVWVCRRLSRCLNPRTFLMCNLYSPARRSLVTLSMRTVTSGTGRFIPLGKRSSKGTENFSNRFVQ
jgi:hypothetical protein